MRILLESYGCTLNKGEAEELATMIQSLGHEIIGPGGQPVNGTGIDMGADPVMDMAIIFTCGVIQTTELKMLKRIGQIFRNSARTMVCGCLGAIAESEILKIAPDAIIFPPASNDVIIQAITGISEIFDPPHLNPPSPGSNSDRIGILRIATECLGDCAYCITKFARGQLKSREMDEIREKASTLISSGILELQVTSQDTAVYGMDMVRVPSGGNMPRLPDVLDTITSIQGSYMVRVGMMNPAATLEILEPLTISMGNERMFKFIHLPVQSGNDEVLANMRRRYTTSDFENIINNLRKAHPDIYISTDIITGFPGETDLQFRNSIDLMRRTRLDTINITRFSPRKGTEAADMPEQVLGHVSKERSGQMTALRFEISRNKFSARVGTSIRALATEYLKPGTTFLRTVNYHPVVIEEVLPLGEWYEVNVTGHTDIYMIGRTIS